MQGQRLEQRGSQDASVPAPRGRSVSDDVALSQAVQCVCDKVTNLKSAAVRIRALYNNFNDGEAEPDELERKQ